MKTILAQIDLTGLTADKPAEAANRHALSAREVLSGKRPLPPPPDPSGLPDLFNRAVEAVEVSEAANRELEAASLASDAARVQLEETLADLHAGKTEGDALDAIRAARDADDLCALCVRRSESRLIQATAARRDAFAALNAGCASAAEGATVREVVAVIERLEPEIDPGLRERRSREIEAAIDYLALSAKRPAEIGGAAQNLHERARDVQGERPTPSAIRYFLRDAERVIRFLSSPENPEPQPAPEPEPADKPRRGFPKVRAAR
jgi:hypothetical protein